MLVHSKQDLFVGCRVRLNDGRIAEVDEDTCYRDRVVVLVDGESKTVFVGEALDGDVWIAEVLPGQSCDPDPEPESDPLDVIFDGVDPNTFDGDILDLV